jgi:hypothetical protein
MSNVLPEQLVEVSPPEEVFTDEGYSYLVVAKQINEDYEMENIGFIYTIPYAQVAARFKEVEVPEGSGYLVQGCVGPSQVFNRWINEGSDFVEKRLMNKKLRKAQKHAARIVLEQLGLKRR